MSRRSKNKHSMPVGIWTARTTVRAALHSKEDRV
ncbi:MAG: hypothetical protein IJL73_07525 [Lachnospiraceae bacterium]|nr:hypothetical protein [Lachnospiraceae bacterium]